MWESAYDNTPDKLVKYLTENKDKFPNLKELLRYLMGRV